jgi:hypothetical protein
LLHSDDRQGRKADLTHLARRSKFGSAIPAKAHTSYAYKQRAGDREKTAVFRRFLFSVSPPVGVTSTSRLVLVRHKLPRFAGDGRLLVRIARSIRDSGPGDPLAQDVARVTLGRVAPPRRPVAEVRLLASAVHQAIPCALLTVVHEVGDRGG